jgi:hypothetical protein
LRSLLRHQQRTQDETQCGLQQFSQHDDSSLNALVCLWMVPVRTHLACLDQALARWMSECSTPARYG